MYDVDYLVAPPPFDRSIVYRYRSGILLPAMRQAFVRALENVGRQHNSTSAAAFADGLLGVTLFPDFTGICEWPRRKPKGTLRHAPSILGLIGEAASELGIFIARYDDAIFDRPAWRATANRCLVIEEPVASSETIDEIVEYLFQTTDIRPLPESSSGLIGYFRAVLEQEGAEELYAFGRRFDDILLLHSDRSTGAFVAPAIEVNRGLERSYIMAPLRRLVFDRREGAVDELVYGLEIRLRQRALAPGAVFRDLHEISDRLLAGEVGAGRGIRRIDSAGESGAVGLALWACMLLVANWRFEAASKHKAETLPPRADQALTRLHRLASDFYGKISKGDSQHLMAELWPAFDALLEFFATDDPEGEAEAAEKAEREAAAAAAKKAEREAAERAVKSGERNPNVSDLTRPRRKTKVRRHSQLFLTRARTIKTLSNFLRRAKKASVRPVWIDRLEARVRPAVNRRVALDEGDTE